jgi:aminoglycoside phosphotransferase (APT) family kinase protein
VDTAEIARRFELGGAARLSDEPVSRGKQGELWRLTTSDGVWAVKAPFHAMDEDEMRPSASFQEAAAVAGVPTTRVQRTTEGDVVATIAGASVRVYEWVDLLAPDPALDPELVGATVAAVHQVSISGSSQIDGWYTEPVGARQWDALIEQLRLAAAPFAEEVADLRDELVALESWLEPARIVQMCHRDLWADNVLPTADGGVCIVDWENSGPADPRHELACVLFEFARTDVGRARALVNAYEAAGGPYALETAGDFSMLIAQLGHITELAAKDWLRPGLRSPDRASAEAWIRETLDEPHSRELLLSLLTAAGGAP